MASRQATKVHRSMTGGLVYLVQEHDFDYNDEIYSKQDGGQPQSAFEREEDAREACRKLNLAWLQENDLSDYGYELSEVFTCSEQQVGQLLGNPEFSFEDGNVHLSGYTPAQVEALIPFVSVLPFSVISVQLKD